MKFIEQIERIQYLDKLIKKKSTGNPKQLANRLGISRSQLYNLINYLSDIGMKVKFSRSLQTFYYDCQGKDLEINFSIRLITDEEVYKIYGGSVHLSSSIQVI